MQVLARARRHDMGLTQQDAAARAGVSRKWLVNFESGAASAVELSLVLRLFAALDMQLSAASPDDAVVDSATADDEPPVDLDEHLAAMGAAAVRSVARAVGNLGQGRRSRPAQGTTEPNR
jgi:HTH-type transcriptional regulator/antitoxin HipB